LQAIKGPFFSKQETSHSAGKARQGKHGQWIGAVRRSSRRGWSLFDGSRTRDSVPRGLYARKMQRCAPFALECRYTLVDAETEVQVLMSALRSLTGYGPDQDVRRTGRAVRPSECEHIKGSGQTGEIADGNGEQSGRSVPRGKQHGLGRCRKVIRDSAVNMPRACLKLPSITAGSD
jgi:hypothetical protein